MVAGAFICVKAAGRGRLAEDYSVEPFQIDEQLAAMVNLVEMLCTASLPALYTQILSIQALTAAQYYAYLALYVLVYMLDDSLLLFIALITLCPTASTACCR